MAYALAFDVYGTLIDPSAMTDYLRDVAGDQAPRLSTLWRETQLSYAFRRAAMRQYAPFSQVTSEALRYALATIGLKTTTAQMSEILAQYRHLPAFGDAEPALLALSGQGHRMHAFSNGTRSDIAALMDTSGLSTFLQAPVSAEDAKSFKPDPRVYTLFETATGASAANTWLISSNPFDIVGAWACGWRTIWVQRDAGVPFDPWGQRPSHIVQDLSQIAPILEPVECV